jgi:hypothetical protein
MASATLRTVRFVRRWLFERATVTQQEMLLDRGDRQVPATLFAPTKVRGPLPGWVVLHGSTRPGRFHPVLLRFARSLASARVAVLVPEVPEWRDLRLAPELTSPTVNMALDALEESGQVGPGPYGLVGFSFGCPQVLIAAAQPEIGSRLAGVVGFGGYCDLQRILRFQMTGDHEWEGKNHHLLPDPYARWIIGGNHLTSVPEYSDAGDVADALWRLAVEAGERRIPAWEASYDPLKEAERRTVAKERRWLFDLFAAPTGVEPDQELIHEFVPRLAVAAEKASPLMNPMPFLRGIEPQVKLLHGRRDRLMPYTETLRLHECFAEVKGVDTTITDLFSHSDQGARLRSRREELRESVKFASALKRVLAMVT